MEAYRHQLQVLEFAGEGTVEGAAATASLEGTSVDTTMLSWIDSPHSYQTGELIVPYAGSDAELMSMLDGMLSGSGSTPPATFGDLRRVDDRRRGQ